LEELGEEIQGYSPLEIAEPEFDADLGPFLSQLEERAMDLPDGPVVILCPTGSQFRRQLDDALARLYRPRRELHLVLPLPFEFEGHSGTLDAVDQHRSLFLARSVTTLDGRGLVSRLPANATIADLFRIQAAKLGHLLADLRLVLAYPRHTYVRRSLEGKLRWEGTWASPASPTEHLATLLRIFEGPYVPLVVCRGVRDPQRMFRMPRRLGVAPFLICRGPDGPVRRLGALFG
jgi:hypothetical protein